MQKFFSHPQKWLYLTFIFLFSSLTTFAQSVAPRIPARIDDANRVTLHGGVPKLALSSSDQGAVDQSTRLTHVRLVLKRSAEQEAALDRYLAELQQKSSPNYHKWLTPEQFGKLYGPADTDMAALTGWLSSHGLSVDYVSKGRTNIEFSGTASVIQSAFKTSIHSFKTNTQSFLSNTSDPQIPAALSSVVTGIAHLNTIAPRSFLKPGPAGEFDSKSHKLALSHAQWNSLTPSGKAQPQLTNTSDGDFLYITAGDVATMYNTPNKTFNANFSSGQSYDGTGVTIGIGGASSIKTSTVADYRSRFVGDSKLPAVNNIDGVGDVSGPDTEAYLDLEASAGIAPGASQIFYTSSDLFSAINQAVEDNIVDIFSLSYGECEPGLEDAGNQEFANWWQQAAGQGIAVIVSTGDSGSAGCDNPNQETEAEDGLQVSGMASTPYNVAVGGTDTYGLVNGTFTDYASTSDNSATYYRSALKYIPESAWNDSTTINSTLSANVPYLNPNNFYATEIWAGSGGPSNCQSSTAVSSNSLNCTAGYPKPGWQRGEGVPADGVRDLPDVAFMAGGSTDDAAWLICTDGTGTVNGVSITADCTTQSDGNFYFSGVGGTSAATPAFAAMLALIQQKTGSRLGLPTEELYGLFNGPHNGEIFHDITIGNNSVPCDTTSSNGGCALNNAGNDFMTGYDTSTGYDLATGMGSIDITNLANYWGTAVIPFTPGVTVTPASTTITSNNSLSVSIAVSGDSSTPTGTVTLTSGNYTSAAITLASGDATLTIPAGSLTIGSDILTVTYSGDGVYYSGIGTAPVTVNSLTPTVTVTPAATAISRDQSLSVQVAVSGTATQPTGTVVLFGSGYTSGATKLVGGSVTITIPAGSLNTGTDLLTATYDGDSTYGTANGTASVAVTAVPPTFAIAGTDLTVKSGSSGTSTITVTPANGYTGTVNLTCTVTAPSGATETPTCTGGTVVISGAAAKTGAITINTSAATAMLHQPTAFPWLNLGGTAAIAAILFFGIPARRRAWRSSVAVLFAAALFSIVIGCGGSSGPKPSTTTLTASSASIIPGTSETLTASVAPSAATGNVTFYDGSTSLGSQAVSGGTAALTTTKLTTTGNHSITAVYAGDTHYTTSTSTALTIGVGTSGTSTGAYTVTVTATDSANASITSTTTVNLTVD